MRLALMLAHLLGILKTLKGRSAIVERFFDMKISEVKFRSITRACELDGVSFGHYYYWRARQALLHTAISRLDKRKIEEFLRESDKTSYEKLDEVSRSVRALIVSTPHYGNFTFSIMATVERLSRSRMVYVFYDSPEDNASNAVFDLIYSKLYSEGNSSVQIVHNNRKGLLTAVKGLNNGGAVIIMPDVFRRLSETVLVPFLGAARSVLLGTASLAKRTDATILPMLSCPQGSAFGFRSVFGESVNAEDFGQSAEMIQVSNFKATAEMFRQFESMMEQGVRYWQYCDTHFDSKVDLPKLAARDRRQYLSLLNEDPRVNIPVAPIDIT